MSDDELEAIDAEVARRLDEWDAAGRPLADGTHSHPGIDLAALRDPARGRATWLTPRS